MPCVGDVWCVHLYTGVDYVLYVSSEQTGLCGTGLSAAENVAYAGHCQQEQSLDRYSYV